MAPPDSTFQVCRTISADHPSLPGHFPGEPIVPAVVILDEVTHALQDWKRDFVVDAISTVKFLLPLRPQQPFSIDLSARGDGHEIEFTCRVEERVIVQGRLLIRRRSS